MQKVTDSYKVQRSSASISDGQGKKDMDVVAPSSRGVATSLATAVPASPLEQPSSDAHDESALRQFDLTSKFGPCTGMSRLERWERAAQLGLDPPIKVKQLVLKHGESSQFNRCLWEHPF